ncbi:hypothetical protein E2C01_068721 [Portunus trituberculatus]|uniref:MADF domain-containing protein n=1 Tax=Portunus trituberculatus TaxID=210409 RepID=A0A5B7I0V7_PORTR|nr:hypothetical protein [Portunus trituberculatus]
MVHKLKNTKKHQQPEERVETPMDDAPAAAPVDVPSTPISSSPEEGPSATPASQAKKKYRPSHSEIQDYHFNDDQIQTLIDLKDNPCIYKKKDKEYHNNQLKIDLWKKCVQLFPGCSYLQVRKFFEKKRTAFGKIKAADMKSGADARARTAREQEIMTTWGFFRGHIAHAQTTSSQIFSSGHESSEASDVSGLSITSIQRRRNLKKRRLPEAGPSMSQE